MMNLLERETLFQHWKLLATLIGTTVAVAGLLGVGLFNARLRGRLMPTAVARGLAPVADTAPPRADATLDRLVDAHTTSSGGHLGVVVYNLSTGQYADSNADDLFYSASLYKLGVLYTVLADAREGRLNLDDRLTVTARTQRHEGETSLTVGEQMTVAEALRRMIGWSDNTSAYLLLDHVGWERVNEAMRRFGLAYTRVGEPGATTRPSEVAQLLTAIATDRAVDGEASARMRALLLEQKKNDRLPAYLPSAVPVAHKTGELPGVRHDAGIVYGPRGVYVIVVMADGLDDEEAGQAAIARLSAAVYDYFTSGVVALPLSPGAAAVAESTSSTREDLD